MEWKRNAARAWVIDRKTTALIAVVVVLLLATGLFSHNRFLAFEESSHRVARAHEVIDGIETLQVVLVDEETGMRDYLRSGEASFLESYKAAVNNVPKEMHKVRTLTSDNTRQQRYADTLTPLVEKHMGLLKKLTEVRPEGPGRTVWDRIVESKQSMYEIRGVLKNMKEEEQRLLKLRLEKATSTGRATTLALAGSLLLSLMFFAAAVLLVNRNIASRLQTEQVLRHSEQELRESELRYRLLFEQAGDAILVADDEGRYLDANREAERLTGYTRDELLQLQVADVTPAATRNGFAKMYKEFKNQGELAGEYQLLRKDGGTVEVEFAASRVGEDRYQSILRNITQRKEFEQEQRRLSEKLEIRVLAGTQDITMLRRQNELLSTIIATQQDVATAAVDLGAVMSIVAGRTQHLTEADGAVVEMLEGDELVYRAATGTAAHSLGLRLKIATSLSGLCIRSGKALRCEDTEIDDRVDKEAYRKVGVRSMVVVPLVYGDRAIGVLKVMSSRAQAFVDRDEQTLQLLAGLIAAALSHAAAFDAERTLVAERTAALKGSEDRYRQIVEATPNGIWTIDLGGRTSFVNSRMAEMLGYDLEEMVGRSLFDFIDEEARTAAEVNLERCRRGVAEHHDFRFRRKDGTELWAIVSSAPVFENGEYVGALAIVTDLTERRKLEEQFRQAQKMEVVGQLAGGVAHDFNNLLTIISGYSELLLDALPADDRNRALVQEIYKAGERAALLTRQLLAFSRKQVVEPKVLDLNAIVERTDKMLRRLIGEDLRLTTAPGASLNQVKADSGQIEQILMNLAVNARDAMPRGGILTIETSNVDLDEHYAQAHPEVKPGPYVLLAVRDTGCGMTEQVQRHIFEPFFTTKEPGKGTGLGLATVFGIVKQSGGHIGLYSEVGRGTTFKVYLPAVENVGQARQKSESIYITPSATATILLVEDDDQVRAYTRFNLQNFGYTVLEAMDGEDALRLCETFKGRLDLLITDVVMPGMSGRQVAEAVTALQPTIKLLYVSGYTDDAVVHHGVFQAETAFLQKPFTTVALARKVREVLSTARLTASAKESPAWTS